MYGFNCQSNSVNEHELIWCVKKSGSWSNWWIKVYNLCRCILMKWMNKNLMVSLKPDVESSQNNWLKFDPQNDSENEEGKKFQKDKKQESRQCKLMIQCLIVHIGWIKSQKNMSKISNSFPEKRGMEKFSFRPHSYRNGREIKSVTERRTWLRGCSAQF